MGYPLFIVTQVCVQRRNRSLIAVSSDSNQQQYIRRFSMALQMELGEFEKLRPYFAPNIWAEMGAYEKASLMNRMQNYEKMKEMGKSALINYACNQMTFGMYLPKH